MNLRYKYHFEQKKTEKHTKIQYGYIQRNSKPEKCILLRDALMGVRRK